MPGLVPGIHVALQMPNDVDGRDEPGHDVERASHQLRPRPAAAASALYRPFSALLSRNTPCSPNMFQNHQGMATRKGRA